MSSQSVGKSRNSSWQDDDDGAEANVFGEKGNYWDIHNEITDKYDQDMMGRLNSNLDNLLIFVSAHPSAVHASAAQLINIGWSVLGRHLRFLGHHHRWSQSKSK